MSPDPARAAGHACSSAPTTRWATSSRTSAHGSRWSASCSSAARFPRGSDCLKTETHTPTRDEAWALVTEMTQSETLRRHMRSVEAAMRAYARRFGEDEERWGVLGLIH